MPEYTEAFSDATAAALPGADWLRRRRVAAAEAFRVTPLPTAAEEVWRYSPVGELRLEDYRLVGGPAAGSPGATNGTGGDLIGDGDLIGPLRRRLGSLSALVVSCDGRLVHCDITSEAAAAGLVVHALAAEHDAAPSLGGVLAEPPDAFGLMNDAFCASPLVVEVPAGARPADPVAVVNLVRTAGAAVFPRLVVVVGDGAEAQVVNAVLSGEAAAFVVPVTEIDVGPAARLEYLALQEMGPRTAGIELTAADVASQGHLAVGLAALGGGYARSRVDCTLSGRGASGDIAAMYFGEHDQVLDFRTFQNHVGADTNSNLLFVGAVDDRARSIYTGLIRVGPDARGTDAQQTNRILKLSEGVWADSVPNLEIENNDVRCAHASSVGPIDEDHRFYLESRGVPPDVAERLIVEGFFKEVRGRLPVQSVAAGFDEMVRAKIGAEQ